MNSCYANESAFPNNCFVKTCEIAWIIPQNIIESHLRSSLLYRYSKTKLLQFCLLLSLLNRLQPLRDISDLRSRFYARSRSLPLSPSPSNSFQPTLTLYLLVLEPKKEYTWVRNGKIAVRRADGRPVVFIETFHDLITLSWLILHHVLLLIFIFISIAYWGRDLLYHRLYHCI